MLGVRRVNNSPPIVFLGRMVMSYLGNAADRSSRAAIGLISAFVSRTPSRYSPARTPTVGG